MVSVKFLLSQSLLLLFLGFCFAPASKSLYSSNKLFIVIPFLNPLAVMLNKWSNAPYCTWVTRLFFSFLFKSSSTSLSWFTLFCIVDCLLFNVSKCFFFVIFSNYVMCCAFTFILFVISVGTVVVVTGLGKFCLMFCTVVLTDLFLCLRSLFESPGHYYSYYIWLYSLYFIAIIILCQKPPCL
jgi:hypothetical protein